jgi:hypothetical protein
LYHFIYILREDIKRAPQERASAAPLFHLSCTVTGGCSVKGVKGDWMEIQLLYGESRYGKEQLFMDRIIIQLTQSLLKPLLQPQSQPVPVQP